MSRVLLSEFGPPDYHLMNHVTIQMDDGTTQVDHILISRFGVFVIETKDFKGWIFANATHETWTQVLFRLRFKFQNPMFQNKRHVRAVEGLLDFLPLEAIRSVIVFTGDAELKTETPQGVIAISRLVGYLRAQTEEVMSLNRMRFCVGRLETAPIDQDPVDSGRIGGRAEQGRVGDCRAANAHERKASSPRMRDFMGAPHDEGSTRRAAAVWAIVALCHIGGRLAEILWFLATQPAARQNATRLRRLYVDARRDRVNPSAWRVRLLRFAETNDPNMVRV